MKNSQSKKVSLITKFIAMFAIFGVVAMLVSGIFTFMIQTQIYHRECESRLKNITNQLNALITDDGVEALLKNVRMEIDRFVKDAPQFDDITMLGFQFYGDGVDDNAEDGRSCGNS